MKRMVTLMIVSIALGITTVHAENRQHQGMRMMDSGQMQQRFQEMQQMMDRIDTSKNADERRRLMREHMKKMGEMMTDMHAMMGQGMMGKGMMGDGDDGMMHKGNNNMKDRSDMNAMSMDKWQKMMGMRMDMMQGMMEQMVEQMMHQHRQENMKQ